MRTTVLLLLLLAVPWPPAGAGEAQFRQVKLIVETSGQTLGAYQVVLESDPQAAVIVGIEGGAPPEFAGLPAYDRRGLERGKIRLAAFTLNDQGPKGRVCVARLHLALLKPNALEAVRITPEVVATPRGKKFPAKTRLELVPPQDKAVRPVKTEK